MYLQHKSRNHIPHGSVVKQIMQYAIFLVICTWLLYLMKHSLYITPNCNILESKFKEVYVGKLLGRKVNIGYSNNPKELDLYGLDLIELAKTIQHVDEPVDANMSEGQSEDQQELYNKSELMRSVTDEMLNLDEDGKVRIAEGKISIESDDDVNNSIGGVILKTKSDEISGVFQFSDENGIPKHGFSAPSRRNDLQVESFSEEYNSSSSSNQNQSRKVEDCQCQQTWEQDLGKKKKLKKFQSEAVAKKGKRRRLEILFAKRWLNTTRLRGQT